MSSSSSNQFPDDNTASGSKLPGSPGSDSASSSAASSPMTKEKRRRMPKKWKDPPSPMSVSSADTPTSINSNDCDEYMWWEDANGELHVEFLDSPTATDQASGSQSSNPHLHLAPKPPQPSKKPNTGHTSD